METQTEYSENGSSKIRAFRAHWIVPVSRPPIEDGTIVIRGDKIIAVDNTENIRNDWKADLNDLDDAIVFPGFINVHTHLEHPLAEDVPSGFLDYQKSLKLHGIDVEAEQRLQIVRNNISDCIARGTVALADFSDDGNSGALLLENNIFARVFHELKSFKHFEAPHQFREHQRRIKDFPISKELTQHLAPSSVWTVSPPLFRQISINERHIAIHMNMSAAEREFTLNGRGPIKQLLHAWADFDYTWKIPAQSPVDYFFRNHFYAKHNILIHMIDTDLQDIETIKEQPAKVNICVCPRAGEILSLGKAPVQTFLEKGLNICLGTESRMTVPDLDIRNEMIKGVDLYGVTPENVMKFATLNGAYAIGFHKEVGSLDEGKTSRCLLLRGGAGDKRNPYESILESDQAVEWLV